MTERAAPYPSVQPGDFEGARSEGLHGDLRAAAALENAAKTRIVLRPLATPLPLGFLALFFATVSAAGVELGWVPVGQERFVAVGILLLSVPVQLISCVYGFLVRDLVAGTGMGVVAGTWALFGAAVLLMAPGHRSAGLAWALVLSGVALCVPAFAAMESKLLAGGVMLTTVLRWWLTAAYEWGAPHEVKLVAGAVGVALGALALYASLAFELEDQTRETVLPTFRRSSGLEAMTGDLGTQVSRAQNEAGIRKQL